MAGVEHGGESTREDVQFEGIPFDAVKAGDHVIIRDKNEKITVEGIVENVFSGGSPFITLVRKSPRSYAVRCYKGELPPNEPKGFVILQNVIVKRLKAVTI